MKVMQTADDGGRCRGTALACLIALLCVTAPAWADDNPTAEEGPVAEAEDEEADEEASEEDEEAAVERPDIPLFVLPTDGLRGDVSDLVIGRVNEAIRDRVGSLGGVELLPTFEAMHGEATGAAAREAITEAERSYTSGIGLVRAGEFEEAATVLQRSVDILEENVADVTNFDVLTDAIAHLAVAHYQNGYDLDARDYIRQYAHLKPGQTLDPDLFPEGLIALYDEEAERVETAGTGVVDIDADRPGAQVFINGELVGTTPVTELEVTFGEHFLVVRDGDWEWSGTIQVRGRDQEQEEFVELHDAEDDDDADSELPSFYVDLRETLRSGRFDTGMQPYFEELATQTGAEYIGWTITSSEGPDYAVIPFVYRVEDGAIAKGEEVLFNRDLTNVRSRSNQVSDMLATWVVHLPDGQIVEEVDLVEEEEPEVIDEPVAEEETDDEEVAMVEEEQEELPVPGTTPEQGGIGASFPDEPPADERSNRWLYMGIGGGAAAVLAGTLFFVLRGSDPPTGFDAEVEW